MITSKSIRVAASGIISIFMAEQYSIVYTYSIFFVHSLVCEHFLCFHVLAIENTDAMAVGVGGCFRMLVFSGYLQRSGIAGSSGLFIVNFFYFFIF